MEDINKIAPQLSKIKKEVPFRTPEHYFDDFSARLQMKLEAEKKVIPSPKTRIIQFLKPALSLAASFALIFMLVYWPLKTFVPTQVTVSSYTENEMIDNEYLAMLEGIDENSFYALLDEPVSSVEFSDDELISYLSTNATDYEIFLGTEF